jgi:transcriptional regulator with XRE-family HTH domain
MTNQGNELRAHRVSLGLTQEAFAKALGVSPNWISLMEKGHKPVEARTIWMARILANLFERRDNLARQIGAMEKGELRTHTNNQDTTEESLVSARRDWGIADRMITSMLAGEV